jgi:hypothetical protein
MRRTATQHRSDESSAEALLAEVHAYNEAFMELELPWRWDVPTYRSLQGASPDHDCIGTYVERHHPHLLKSYDRNFLRDLILSTKARQRQAA